MKNAQFIGWTVTPDGGKIPVSLRTGHTINPHDPAHWMNEAEARALLRPGTGLGYVFTAGDPYFFIDLDKCLQEDGNWSPLANEICALFPGAYMEVSQSGRGLHIIALTRTIPAHTCKNTAQKIELYHDKRFVALTGTRSQGSADTDHTEPLAVLIDKYFQPTKRTSSVPDKWTTEPCPEWHGHADDNELIEAAKLSKSIAAAFGGKASFADLWTANEDALARAYPSASGDVYDRSSADAALASHLAFWTGRDCERIAQLMRESALVRQKWEREDYFQRTVLNAVAQCRDVHRGRMQSLPQREDGGPIDRELSPRDSTQASRPFRFLRAGALELRAPAWLVRHLLELDTLAEVFGDPGCCKTFFVADIACSIATGADFHGHKVKHVPVFCIVGEGHNGLARRTKAWSIARGISLDNAPLFFSDRAAQLLDPANEQDVFNAIDEMAREHGKPGLITVDTLARNFGPGDENSTADMSRFIQACDRLRSRYGCAVLLVHHTGHGDKSRSRGSMALKGGVDTEIRLDKDEAGIVRVTFTKMKDSTPPEPMAFQLRVVELPITDDEGQPITSAVLHRTDYEAPQPQGKAGKGRWQTVALEQLRKVTADHQRNKVEAGIDPDTARVSLADWRGACIGSGMPHNRFYDTRNSLQQSKSVRIEHGFVFID